MTVLTATTSSTDIRLDASGDRADTPRTAGAFTISGYRPSADVCVVAVDGELDLLTAPLLHAAVREQLAARPAHLVVDLTRVGFLGCAGLAALLVGRDRARLGGTRLHLAGLENPRVARLLQLTGTLGWFTIHPTPAHALDTVGVSQVR